MSAIPADATETRLTSAAPPPTEPDDIAPEAWLNALLGDGRLTIAAAESCTGGNVAGRIISRSGSSAYFLGGIVSYSNAAKHKLLGVPDDILKNPGAVSEPTARAMVAGARRAFAADVAVATTGIAGPTGGTARKPVGTVFIAAGGPAGTTVEEHHFPGDRAAVIAAATEAALRLLVATVEKLSAVSFQPSAISHQPSANDDTSVAATARRAEEGVPRTHAADT